MTGELGRVSLSQSH